MPFAPPYSPTKDFSQDEAINATGRSTVNTAALDAELANVEQSVNAINDNLQVIQRDDNELRDFLIKPRMLSDATRALISGGWNPRGNWQVGVSYAVRDFVEHSGMCYVCCVAHTSNSFLAEVSFWQGVSSAADVVLLTERAETAAVHAEASANSSQNSAALSAASATNAANSAASIAGSVVAAANSALLAEQHKTAAAASATNAASSATQADAAQAPQLNKAWRQASIMASVMGAFVAENGQDALDDGDIPALLAGFNSALNAFTGKQYAPINSPALTGTPTAPTAPQFDNSSKIANTEWVDQRGMQYGDSIYLRNATTLNADAAGKHYNLSGLSAGFAVTLPSAAAVPAGGCITILCSSVFEYTIKTTGADKITPNGAPIASMLMRNGDSLILVSNGVNYWQAVGGSVQYRYADSFAGVGLTNGYKKSPSGIIKQWGIAPCAASASTYVPYVIPFPNACLNYVASGFNTSGNIQAYTTTNSVVATAATVTCFIATSGQSPIVAQTAGSVQIWWQAVGY